MDPWKSQLENIQSTTQLAQRAERIRKEIEVKKNAKNAISIARGTEDWVSNPVNVLGENNSQDSGNKYSDSSFNKLEEMTQNSDKLFTKDELEDNIQNKQNNSLNVLGLISIKPFIIIVAMVVFAAGILSIRRNSSSQ